MLAELGHGGMADVFLAAVEGPAGSGFTKLAVVKQLRSHLAEDPEFIQMLMDEARITARLSHPNVVQLFEMGQVDDHYFLAMEYLQGQPLDRLERRTARVRPDLRRELFYAVVSDMLAGLHHAHELTDYDGTPLDIVHRDVTPHNVFVTYDGVIKVVDFGIAKAAGRATETRQGLVKGKFRYMSPEQVRGKDVDRRTDVFAAGVILWQAATGTRLWADYDDLAVQLRLAQGQYDASPRDLCPDVPPEIDAICRKALAFDRGARYSTAHDMRAEIEAYLQTRPGDLRKELASAAKEMFAKERLQVKSILEGAGLSRAASPKLIAHTSSESFRAAQPAGPDGSGDGGSKGDASFDDPPEEGAHTVLMANAPPLPRPAAPPAVEVVSVAAMATPAVAARDPRSNVDRTRPPAAQARRGPLAVIAGVAAVALAVAGGVLAVLANRRIDAGAGTRDQPVTVEPDHVSSSPELRSKTGAGQLPSPAPSADDAGAGPQTRPLGPRPGQRPPDPPPTTHTAPPPPGPSAKPPAGASSKPTAPLDHSDPWAQGGR